MMISKNSYATVIAGFTLCLATVNPVLADTSAVLDFSQYTREKLSIGIAAGYERFDTTTEFTDKTAGRPPIFIDAEGTLGLEESQFIPILYGYWSASPRHGFGFSYFGTQREGTKFAIDKNIGDLNVTGRISMSDDSRFYHVSYNYTVFADDRVLVLASAGLFGVDLKAAINMEGTISLGGVPIASGEYIEEVSEFAPLPVIGVTAWFAITPRWSMGSKVLLVGGEVNNVRAKIFTSNINARYALNKNLSLLFGFNFFSADVTIDKTRKKTAITYGFEGVYLGVDVGF